MRSSILILISTKAKELDMYHDAALGVKALVYAVKLMQLKFLSLILVLFSLNIAYAE